MEEQHKGHNNAVRAGLLLQIEDKSLWEAGEYSSVRGHALQTKPTGVEERGRGSSPEGGATRRSLHGEGGAFVNKMV